MVSCSRENFGCEGGYLMNALDYLMSEGVTTEECRNYESATGKCRYECIDK